MDYRLKKEKDFNAVFNKGKKLYSASLTMIYLPSDKLKVGYVVSKKHGNSVKRNRIKRLLRESFRSFELEQGQNFFFVIMPRVKEDYSLEQFKKDMYFCFSKGGFLS